MKNNNSINTSNLTSTIGGFIMLGCLILTFGSCYTWSNSKKSQTPSTKDRQTVKEKVPQVNPANSVLKKHGHFTPSHRTQIKLIEREDKDFNTPVEITYQEPTGKIWTAPILTITDGASIPKFLASFFGGKLNKEFLFAAIVHDAYSARANKNSINYQSETWQDTHHMFYYACLANGAGITKASIMYAGVRLGGPRWSFQKKPFTDLSRVKKSVLIDEMKACIEWIESKGESLTLDEIDEWMKNREPNLLKDQ